MTEKEEDFNPEIRIVPVACPNCGDCNMEAYLLNKEDMIMNCWECGFVNHTNIYEWEWDEFGYDDEEE